MAAATADPRRAPHPGRGAPWQEGAPRQGGVCAGHGGLAARRPVERALTRGWVAEGTGALPPLGGRTGGPGGEGMKGRRGLPVGRPGEVASGAAGAGLGGGRSDERRGEGARAGTHARDRAVQCLPVGGLSGHLTPPSARPSEAWVVARISRVEEPWRSSVPHYALTSSPWPVADRT